MSRAYHRVMAWCWEIRAARLSRKVDEVANAHWNAVNSVRWHRKRAANPKNPPTAWDLQNPDKTGGGVARAANPTTVGQETNDA